MRRTLTGLAASALLLLSSSPPVHAGSAFIWRIPVLEVHFTTCPVPYTDGAYLHICEDAFRAQLEYLVAHGWVAISGKKLRQHFNTATPFGPKRFVISIDDGTTERYDSTFKLLNDMGLPGTFMLVTERVGLPGQITWDQIREMRDGGMDIENHSARHPRMADLPYAEQLAEIMDAQATFETELGYRPSVFALPYGSYNDDTLRALRDSDLSIGFSSINGIPTVSSAAPFLIHRIPVPLFPKPADLAYRMSCTTGCTPWPKWPAGMKVVRAAE